MADKKCITKSYRISKSLYKIVVNDDQLEYTNLGWHYNPVCQLVQGVS